jgi:hypothetical protein
MSDSAQKSDQPRNLNSGDSRRAFLGQAKNAALAAPAVALLMKASSAMAAAYCKDGVTPKPPGGGVC